MSDKRLQKIDLENESRQLRNLNDKIGIFVCALSIGIGYLFKRHLQNRILELDAKIKVLEIELQNAYTIDCQKFYDRINRENQKVTYVNNINTNDDFQSMKATILANNFFNSVNSSKTSEFSVSDSSDTCMSHDSDSCNTSD